MCAKALQPCPTLCDPTGLQPASSSVYGDSPGKNTGMGCHALLQGIFPAQELNTPPGDLPNPGIEPRSPALQVLYHLSHQGNPRILSLLQANFLTQESNWGLLHCRQILYQLSYQGRPSSPLLQSLCGSITQQGFLSKIGFTSVPLPQRSLFLHRFESLLFPPYALSRIRPPSLDTTAKDVVQGKST